MFVAKFVSCLMAILAVVEAVPTPDTLPTEGPGVYYAYRFNQDTICYGVLGCFNNSGPFNDYRRPLQPLPDSPAQIGTKFSLYTRAHRDVVYPLWSWNSTTLGESDFQASRKTKIIVHGYMNNAASPWVKKMSDALLRVGDFNVIVVDWILGAVDLYQQSAVNTRVVGAEVWFLVSKLQELKGLRNEDVHIIGHSLGAHIAGYAGQRLPGLGRISGLDPAQPYFEHTDPAVRLDPTDASFVDVVHSDTTSFIKSLGTGGYGIGHRCGHVDFYPNGGRDQPDCNTSGSVQAVVSVGILEGMRKFVSCNHMRAIYLYTESIDNSSCAFTAFPCDSYEQFQAGECSYCGSHCATMGYYSDQLDRRYLQPTNYYVKTGTFPVYCRRNYFLRLETGHWGLWPVHGQIYVELLDSRNRSSGFREVTDGPEDISGSRTFLLLTNVTVTEPAALSLRWKPATTWLGLGIVGHSGDEEISLNKVGFDGSNVYAEVFKDIVVMPNQVVRAPLKFIK